MELPFFWYHDSLNITTSEWAKMGTIDVRQMNPLLTIDDGPHSLDITVIAWATEVSMDTPTSMPLAANIPRPLGRVTPQADEYGTGPISKPASIIARLSGMLQKAPVIGPYALATSMAAGALANWATLFGYSRPALLDTPKPYKPMVVGNLANTNVPDSVQRLTLDCKQELTVDPRTVGLSGTDEMTLKSIITRESYLTTFDWTTEQSTDTSLFAIMVTPDIASHIPGSNGDTEIHMPAVCFAFKPFQYWRGTMKYRFQIVGSSFHKGRLLFTWDPIRKLNNDLNTKFSKIVDLAETTDFEIEIGMGQHQAFLREDSDVFTNRFGTVQNATGQQYNGVLSCTVLNNLVVPGANQVPVQVNVFVSGCDDMEFRDPTDFKISRISYFPTPTPPARGRVVPQSDEPAIPVVGDSPVGTEDKTMIGLTSDPTDPLTHVYFGEEVVSFRQCLKRYCRHFGDSVGLTEVGGFWTINQANFPYYTGHAPSAYNSTIKGNYNYSHNTLLNWLTPAYGGWRGSLRWKTVIGNTKLNSGSLTQSRRTFWGGFSSLVSALTLPNRNTMAYQMLTGLEGTWSGAASTVMTVNPVLEVEIPFALNKRFVPGGIADYQSDDFDDFIDSTETNALLLANGAVDFATRETYVSTGEDFSLFFFLGAPIAYRNSGGTPLPG